MSGGSVPNNFIPAVEKGVKERMEKGVIAGYQVQDVSCELFFGKDHPVDSNETAFRTAGSMCFRNIFREAKPVLLEPIVTAEITVPAEKLGDITSDLNGRRGRVEGMDNAPGRFPGDPRKGAAVGNDDLRPLALEHDGRPRLIHDRVQPLRRRPAQRAAEDRGRRRSQAEEEEE